jgi:2Fe-2S ferredoxin
LPRVRVEPAGLVLEAREGETILAAAQRLGLHWPTVCGGQAECLACALVVDGDGASLSPVGERERTALERLPERLLRPDAQHRLACQARMQSDAVVYKRGVRPAGATPRRG